MDNDAKMTFLENRVIELENELKTMGEKLKKYTAPASRKVYYEKHKDEEKIRAKEYKERTGYKYKPTPEQKDRYYQNLKAKRQQKREEAAKLKENVK